jgi:deoxyribodipyrimidine photo-lyase
VLILCRQQFQYSKILSMINIFWFRRDLRLNDNAGLYHALKSGLPVLPLFIFDKNILDKLEDRADARVSFLHDTIAALSEELKELGSSLLVKYGDPEEVWTEILKEYPVQDIYYNHDFESYAKNRDEKVADLIQKKGGNFYSFKDHVIFEKLEVTKKDGLPYTVFTPYSRRWKELLQSRTMGGELFYLKAYPTEKYVKALYKCTALPLPGLEFMGFEKSKISIPSKQVSREIIKNYDKNRNFPAIEGTSKLGIHFRFGTISIREKARKAMPLNETYLNELIWRDFYSQILVNFPKVEKKSFRTQYDFIEWRNDEIEFQAWCQGKTGYPLVDAGMRELNATGFMHNRVRMLVASFLVKHLLIDWRWGEAYFAQKLLDFDLASNNGGWQWAAGCGTDAAPYFRIFSPDAQAEKFDKEQKYIRKWIKEYGTEAYPKPIVNHKDARDRCLEVFKKAVGPQNE